MPLVGITPFHNERNLFIPNIRVLLQHDRTVHIVRRLYLCNSMRAIRFQHGIGLLIPHLSMIVLTISFNLSSLGVSLLKPQ